MPTERAGSAAMSGRTRTCRTRAAKARFFIRLPGVERLAAGRKLLTKATLFLNRSSGVKTPPAEIEAFDAAVREAGLEVIELSADINCPQIIRERIARGTSLFIAAGGDGTVHHVIQALVNTTGELAVIPNGTYNHFAKDVGIPLDWREALEVAL